MVCEVFWVTGAGAGSRNILVPEALECATGEAAAPPRPHMRNSDSRSLERSLQLVCFLDVKTCCYDLK